MSLPRRAWLARPELGAVAGTVLVWAVFTLAAGIRFTGADGFVSALNAAAPLGILAVAVALLMIGGEFDLSVGSLIGACGMTAALLVAHFGWPFWPAAFVSLLLAIAVGLLNGWIVLRTGLPSFLVTLATLFVLRGLTIGTSRAVTGRTQLGGLADAAGAIANGLFASDVGSVRAAVFWWIALTLVGAWILSRTAPGNWIFATGGDARAARASGVPVTRVKLGLFVATAVAAWLVAMIQAVRFGGTDALRGEGQEFRAIIAAVIGGALLTGGWGSVIGAALGALIFGMVQQGIVITGIDADWFQVVLGVMLLAAVLFNEAVRRRAAAMR